MQGLNRIGVLTSGGDAPGMNACLRAIVRTGIFYGREVVGIEDGYDGLIKGNMVPMSLRSVGNIIQRGGTILGSSRSEEFMTKAGRKTAHEKMEAWNLSSLIVLGGDGTLAGAAELSKEFSINTIGVPCTIDNDIVGTDFSIGFDTALNTAVEAIDKIRDTADSHDRVFMIEVMGRNTGHIALETALAAGAEYAIIPEAPFDPKPLVAKITAGIDRGKSGSIVVVAEKDTPGWVFEIAKIVKAKIKRDVRSAILGHLQRGGSPSVVDRNLASRLGAKAVELIVANKNRVMVGVRSNQMVEVDFKDVIGKREHADLEKLKLIDILSM